MRSLIKVLFVFLFSTPVLAASPAFTNLNKSDMEGIVKDFTSVTAHTSVSPASSLGKIFGFEVGLVAGAAQTPKVESLAKKVDSTSEVTMLPSAGLFAAVTFPLGFTGEAVVLPSTTISDVTVGNTSLAAKWTLTDVIPAPFEMALKLSMTTSEISYTGQVGGNPVKFSYDGSVTGLIFQGSQKFTIFEPYFNVGMVKAKGKMKASDEVVFNDAYAGAGATSAEEEASGAQYAVGINFNLLVLKLGLEAGKVLDATKAAAKLSFYF